MLPASLGKPSTTPTATAAWTMAKRSWRASPSAPQCGRQPEPPGNRRWGRAGTTFMNLTEGTYTLQQGVLPLRPCPPRPETVEIILQDEQNATGVIFGSVISADLRVEMTFSLEKKRIIYTITVTNDGPAEAIASLLTDPITDGISFVSVSTTLGTCSGGKTVSCDFGPIASGGSITVTLTVNRVDTKIPVVNTVNVSSSTFDINLANNLATLTIP